MNSLVKIFIWSFFVLGIYTILFANWIAFSNSNPDFTFGSYEVLKAATYFLVAVFLVFYFKEK